MTLDSWVAQALGKPRLEEASTEASRHRLNEVLGLLQMSKLADSTLRFAAQALELLVFDLLDGDGEPTRLRQAAAEAFQLLRALPLPEAPLARAEELLHRGALATLGDRGADMRRLLLACGLPDLPVTSDNWGERVWATVVEVWLRLLRKDGWQDLDAVQRHVLSLREAQARYEPGYLETVAGNGSTAPAWRIVAEYHLSKAAELLATYLTQGSAGGHFDIAQQLEAQFDRAIDAATRAQQPDFESLTRLLARCARALVDSSLWSVTRAVNSRVTRFVGQVISRSSARPLFEALPPQRRALREAGLLGSSRRAVVVSLPTSSGKTFIAEFRILQALNQFDEEKGWVVWLAPTRALVNQLAVRLRRDFSPLGISVERLSPALEIDGLEEKLLLEGDARASFRVLVATPEKLDLLLRSGWEQRIARPLTLVVVDEAQGLRAPVRGLRLELLLATINRECRHAQFLLLTPFIPNAEELSRWLSPDSHQEIELGLDWTPNDRAVALATARPGPRHGSFQVSLQTLHTTRSSIHVPEPLYLAESTQLGLSWKQVSKSTTRLAAATARLLDRGQTTIILAATPRDCWSLAGLYLKDPGLKSGPADSDLAAVQEFLCRELGEDYPLGRLLESRVGVHHGGLSDEARALVEWLAEKGKLRFLVATTTLAQGVNFPVSAVVFASHHYRSARKTQKMPPEDFWNIAGRAGRVDQGDLGLVVLAAESPEKAKRLEEFVGRAVDSLNSTLLDMVQEAMEQGELLPLEKLSSRPEWSAFLQYLVHTYRQIGNHEQFALQIEQVLRGTLGFQALRKRNSSWANILVSRVRSYAERLQGARGLKLVDSTGFSLESVHHTLARLSEARIHEDAWSGELFGRRQETLRRMMGVLLQVPELREQLAEVTGGKGPDGEKLADILCDWVQGRPLPEMAREHFGSKEKPRPVNAVDALTRCCQSLFGRLTQTASWGLAALQALTLGNRLERLSAREQQTIRNLPARVYYGVNSDEAIALRMLGVPRTAATPLARSMGVDVEQSHSALRANLRRAGMEPWIQALGRNGANYRRVWAILEGEDSSP